MLIRGGLVYMNGAFHRDVEVRIHHGRIHELGCGLAAGLYETVVELDGDFLLPGFVAVQVPALCGHDVTQGEAELRRLSRALFKCGVSAFRAAVGGDAEAVRTAEAAVRRLMLRPVQSGAQVLGLDVTDGPAGAIAPAEAFTRMLHSGVAPEEAVRLCTEAPAEALGERLAGHMTAGSPAPLTRWSKDWRWKGILA